MQSHLMRGPFSSTLARASRHSGGAFACCVGAALLLSSVAADAQPLTLETPLRVDDYTSKYDDYFRHYSQRYFGPYVDWRWFKAQAIAESRLNPNARSFAGACGVMQLLPQTFDEIRLLNPNWDDINTPRWNIAAGIYYSRTLYQQWNGSLHGHDRFLLALASYNAGFQRVRNAYGITPRARSFNDVRASLPAETRNYLDRIQYLMEPKELELTRVVARLD